MKEWHYLLTVIDSFVYDKDLEEIVFDNTEKSLEAKKLYNGILKEYNFQNEENEKWAFDIALDCVRKMRDEDRAYLKESYEVDFFGYGLYIRNEYIHCATKHRGFFCADSQCSVVLSFIYTIMHRYYNRFNSKLCKLLDDYNYQSVYKKYNDRFSCVEEETLKLADPQCGLTPKEVLKAIKDKVREQIGRNGFKDILVSVVNECGKDCLEQKAWLNFVNALYRECPVYTKEYQQIKALKEMGLISSLLSTYNFDNINSVDDCKEHIIENIGFTEDDAQLLSEALWAAFKTN